MAETWDSKRLKVEREYDARLVEDMRRLGGDVSRVVMRFARVQVIPNVRDVRDGIRRDVWSLVLKPYFIGGGDEALVGIEPRSPFTRLIVGGIREAITVQAERQVAIVRKYASGAVLDWLTAPRPVGEFDGSLFYDPFHLFVYGNSPYRLSDRVWITAREVRARIDALLDYHIPRGTAAVTIADELVGFLTPGEVGRMTKKPYGVEGSYSARRLARTEITAAGGRATVNASIVNPFVDGIRWRLSASHPKVDHCDVNATGGVNGDGVYPPENFPKFPDHPHCMCACLPQVVRNPAVVVDQLRFGIEARSDEAMRLRGVFNLGWLVPALMGGYSVFSD